MDLQEFRNVMNSLKVDIWDLIDSAIHVASVDHAEELKNRRDAIVERLYVPNSVFDASENRNGNGTEKFNQELEDVGKSYNGVEESEEFMDMKGNQENDEQKKILVIKKDLEDPDQSEQSLIDLLQCLLNMDISFSALKETDVGRHVNRFRKHSSNEVRRLVKLLVRKWKQTVDEWVRQNAPLEPGGSPSNGDGDSPFDHSHQKNNIQSCLKETVPPPNGNAFRPPLYLTQKREMKDNLMDSEKFASARRSLHENYQEAQNDKKQKTTHVMDFHDVSNTRNSFVVKNRGGIQLKHW